MPSLIRMTVNDLFQLGGSAEIQAVVVALPDVGLVGEQGSAEGRALGSLLGRLLPGLSNAGAALGLGSLVRTSVQSEERNAVAVFRQHGFISVVIDPRRSLVPIERKLDQLVWDDVRGFAPQAPRQVDEESLQIEIEPAPEPWNGASTTRFLVRASPNTPPSSEDVLFGLRDALARGDTEKAKGILQALGEELPGDTLADGDVIVRPHLKGLVQRVAENVVAIRGGDCCGGAGRLREVVEDLSAGASMRWVASLWSAGALVSAGDLTNALAMADESVYLSADLDQLSRARSLLVLAEAKLQSTEVAVARRLLNDARLLLLHADPEDPESCARSWLIEARLLAMASGRELEAVQAARQCLEILPGWTPAVVWLIRFYVLQDMMDQLAPLAQQLPRDALRAPEVVREGRIVKMARDQKVSLLVVKQYFGLENAFPSPAILCALEELVNEVPSFGHIREGLAWKLFRAGRWEESTQHFNELLQLEDAKLRSSAVRGLGCIADAASRRPSRAAPVAAHEVASRGVQNGSPDRTDRPAAHKQSTRSRRVIPPPLPRELALKPAASPKTTDDHETRRARQTAFSGELQIFPLTDLLEFLRSNRRTGALVLSSGAGSAEINLREGQICGAHSPRCVRLGDELAGKGLVSREAIEAVLRDKRAQRSDQVLGQLLIEQCGCAPAVVRNAFVQQVYGAMREILTWTTGSFTFDAEPADSSRKGMNVEIDPQQVLLALIEAADAGRQSP